MSAAKLEGPEEKGAANLRYSGQQGNRFAPKRPAETLGRPFKRLTGQKRKPW